MQDKGKQMTELKWKINERQMIEYGWNNKRKEGKK